MADVAPSLDARQRYGWGEKEETWRLRAERFARERLRAQAREADREGRFPDGLVRELGEAALIGVAVPASHGGHGGSTLADCLVAEEIGAADGSVRGFLAVQGGLVLAALGEFGSSTQRTQWTEALRMGRSVGAFALTEPGAGSDLGGMAARATEDADGILLEGEKIWITNGLAAEVLLVFAAERPAERTRGLSAFVVPTDVKGLQREAMSGHPMGHRASDHARLQFTNVRLPHAARLGAAGEGFRVAMAGLGAGRLHVAAGAVGIQRAALEATVAHARVRRQFGRRIGDFQQVGAALADMALRLETSRLLVHHAARLRDAARGANNAGLEGAAADAVAMAKLHATEAAVATSLRAIQLHGARGYSDECEVERLHRDAIALTIYEGTSEIQRTILMRSLLGRDEGETR